MPRDKWRQNLSPSKARRRGYGEDPDSEADEVRIPATPTPIHPTPDTLHPSTDASFCCVVFISDRSSASGHTP